MNFKEWHNDFWGVLTSTHDQISAETAWNACKNEVFKILENNKHEICSHGFEAGMGYFHLDDVKEEIEKL